MINQCKTSCAYRTRTGSLSPPPPPPPISPPPPSDGCPARGTKQGTTKEEPVSKETKRLPQKQSIQEDALFSFVLNQTVAFATNVKLHILQKILPSVIFNAESHWQRVKELLQRTEEKQRKEQGREAAEQRSRGAEEQLSRGAEEGADRYCWERAEEGRRGRRRRGGWEEGQTRWLLGWVSESGSESNIIGDSLRDSCWELGEVLRWAGPRGRREETSEVEESSS